MGVNGKDGLGVVLIRKSKSAPKSVWIFFFSPRELIECFVHGLNENYSNDYNNDSTTTTTLTSTTTTTKTTTTATTATTTTMTCHFLHPTQTKKKCSFVTFGIATYVLRSTRLIKKVSNDRHRSIFLLIATTCFSSSSTAFAVSAK